MSIVLGIYRGPHFKDVATENNSCAYPFIELIGDYWVDEAEGVIDTVLQASIKCDKIIFLIDGLLPNITGNEDSYTCQELITLLKCPSISIDKIEFREENQLVNSIYEMNKLNLCEELFN